MAEFGSLLSCCVSDEASSGARVASAVIFFASGMAASGLTLYLASLLHVL
jgi:hypothetical protein